MLRKGRSPRTPTSAGLPLRPICSGSAAGGAKRASGQRTICLSRSFQRLQTRAARIHTGWTGSSTAITPCRAMTAGRSCARRANPESIFPSIPPTVCTRPMKFPTTSTICDRCLTRWSATAPSAFPSATISPRSASAATLSRSGAICTTRPPAPTARKPIPPFSFPILIPINTTAHCAARRRTGCAS